MVDLIGQNCKWMVVVAQMMADLIFQTVSMATTEIYCVNFESVETYILDYTYITNSRINVFDIANEAGYLHGNLIKKYANYLICLFNHMHKSVI